MNAQRLVLVSTADAFRPEPLLTVSQWADKYRQVGRPSPEQGDWRTSRVPYTREIMDRLSPSDPCQIVVVMKAAQMAFTEVELNALGCWAHRYPDSGMLVLPTTKTAKQFVRVRLDPMIEVNPTLSAIVAPPRSRSRSNTVALKEFQGAMWAIVGANSGNDLRSYPGRYALMDEVDGYPPDLDGEGDPTELVIQRTATYRKRKILLISTPTLELTSIINRWFHRGDQNYYHVPCPSCRFYQKLVWGARNVKEGRRGGLRWPSGKPDEAMYECEACGDHFDESAKLSILQRGEWRPSAPDNYNPKTTGIRSYHINALYGPYGWPGNKWATLAAQWETDHKDPIKNKTFINLKLGEPYIDPVEAKANATTLFVRREAYGPEVPSGACVLTASADVQADRIEAELVAWGPYEESWSMDYRVFPGDTSKITSSCWIELDHFLSATYIHSTGALLAVKACCVDSGYNRQVVTTWCAERSARRIWATLGRAGQHPIWDAKWRKLRGKYAQARIIGVDAAKEVVYSSFRVMEPGARYCHFPMSMAHDMNYFEMLTSEVRVPDYTGPIPRYIWKKKSSSDRNEALDCRVGAYVALLGLQLSYGLRLPNELAALRRSVETGQVGKANKSAVQIQATPQHTVAPNDPITDVREQVVTPQPRPSSKRADTPSHPAAIYSSDPWL